MGFLESNSGYEILEANNTFGGCVKINIGFTDFPMDIGAEWIHTQPDVFSRLIDNNTAEGSIDLIPYQLETLQTYKDGSLMDWSFGTPVYGQYKFKSTTWFEFFENFIIPSIENKISYNRIIESVDYSNDQVVLTDSEGNVYTGDKVILIIPTQIHKKGRFFRNNLR